MEKANTVNQNLVGNAPIGPTAIKFFKSDKYGKEYENDVFVGSNNNHGILYHFKLDKDRSNFVLKPPLNDKIANNFNESNEIIFGQGFGLISDIDVGPDGYLIHSSFRERCQYTKLHQITL